MEGESIWNENYLSGMSKFHEAGLGTCGKALHVTEIQKSKLSVFWSHATELWAGRAEDRAQTQMADPAMKASAPLSESDSVMNLDRCSSFHPIDVLLSLLRREARYSSMLVPPSLSAGFRTEEPQHQGQTASGPQVWPAVWEAGLCSQRLQGDSEGGHSVWVGKTRAWSRDQDHWAGEPAVGLRAVQAPFHSLVPSARRDKHTSNSGHSVFSPDLQDL